MADRSFRLSQTALDQLSDFPRKTISISDLQAMQRNRDTLAATMKAAEGYSSTAASSIRNSVDTIANERKEIRRLFSLVRSAANSKALDGVDPEALRLTSGDVFDPLGMFCRLSIAVQMSARKPIAEGRAKRLELENELTVCLEQSFRDPLSLDDSKLVITELANLMEQRANFLIDWNPEGRHRDKSTPVVESPLIALLEKQVRADMKESRSDGEFDIRDIAWLSHKPGWNESMHASIIRLFASMGSREDQLSKQARVSALHFTRDAIKYWVVEDLKAQAIIKQNQTARPDEIRSVPPRYVTVNDLLTPWSAVLKISRGKSTDTKTVFAITEVLTKDALQKVKEADYTTLKSEFIPMHDVLVSCSKTKESALNPLGENSREFVEAVRARHRELKTQTQTEAGKIREQAPEAPKSQGIDFESLKTPSGLALPSPVQFRREQRLSFTPKPPPPDDDDDNIIDVEIIK